VHNRPVKWGLYLFVIRQSFSRCIARCRSDTRAVERTKAVTFPLILFALNALVCTRLFHAEHFDQFPSIEGGFLAVERHIRMHWSWWNWFPTWWGGMPFSRVYQPVLHYLIAIVSAVTGASVPSTFHFVTAVIYSLGAVAFYWLARVLLESRQAAFAGALLFSLFSPSLLFFPLIRRDANGWWTARRLQALVQYGEGPGIAGIALAMLAIALVHLALRKRTAVSTCLAGFAVAAVPATNWPMTIALLMGLTTYVIALEWRTLWRSIPRLLLIGLIACGAASIPAPPSQILGTFRQANLMDPRPRDLTQWLAIALLVVSLALLRMILGQAKAPFALRFPALFLWLVGYLVAMDLWLHLRLMPFAYRFHVAMEIPLILIFTFLAKQLVDRFPRLRRPAIALLAVFCIVQTVNYRRYLGVLMHRVDVHKTVEYQVAQWCEKNLHGERILTFGSVMFWLNAFTDTPQMTGLFEHSLTNSQDMSYGYMVKSAGSTADEAADGSILWMKALAVHAVAIGGPESREAYRGIAFPYRYRGKFPLVWSDGDDSIYSVPERVPGLARVVRERDIVKRPPQNGLDLVELRPFVAALDDATLPIATFAWQGPNDARIQGVLAADQVYSVSINWSRGWTATMNGLPIPVRADGLGLIVIAPHSSGPCEVELHWSAAPESWIVTLVTLSTLLGCGLWIWRERRRQKPLVRSNRTRAAAGILAIAAILSGLSMKMHSGNYSFSGRWSDQNKYPIFIHESGNVLTVRYLPVHHPGDDFPGRVHTGRRVGPNQIWVDFGSPHPGESCCAGSLRQGRIEWSNHTYWQRDERAPGP